MSPSIETGPRPGLRRAEASESPLSHGARSEFRKAVKIYPQISQIGLIAEGAIVLFSESA